MKIGVVGCLYGCPEYLDFLKPWFEAYDFELELAFVHSQFKEYHELGYPDNDKETLDFLLSSKCPAEFVWYNNGYSDYLGGDKSYLPEHEVRNKGLEYLLKRKCSHIFLLDLDEKYERKDIEGLASFADKEDFTTWFSVQFRNLTFSEHTYTKNFSPPRLFKVNNYGYKLSRFFWDNDLMYVDKEGKEVSYTQFSSQRIPTKFVNPLHYSWLNN